MTIGELINNRTAGHTHGRHRVATPLLFAGVIGISFWAGMSFTALREQFTKITRLGGKLAAPDLSKPKRFILEPEKVLAADKDEGITYTLAKGWKPHSFIENAAGDKITTITKMVTDKNGPPAEYDIMLQISDSLPEWSQKAPHLQPEECAGICIKDTAKGTNANLKTRTWYFLKGNPCPSVVTLYKNMGMYYEFRFGTTSCPGGKFGSEYLEYLATMDSVTFTLNESAPSWSTPLPTKAVPRSITPTQAPSPHPTNVSEGLRITPTLTPVGEDGCPREEWIDCLPGSSDKSVECDPSYLQWAHANCPSFKGIAY